MAYCENWCGEIPAIGFKIEKIGSLCGENTNHRPGKGRCFHRAIKYIKIIVIFI